MPSPPPSATGRNLSPWPRPPRCSVAPTLTRSSAAPTMRPPWPGAPGSPPPPTRPGRHASCSAGRWRSPAPINGPGSTASPGPIPTRQGARRAAWTPPTARAPRPASRCAATTRTRPPWWPHCPRPTGRSPASCWNRRAGCAAPDRMTRPSPYGIPSATRPSGAPRRTAWRRSGTSATPWPAAGCARGMPWAPMRSPPATPRPPGSSLLDAEFLAGFISLRKLNVTRHRPAAFPRPGRHLQIRHHPGPGAFLAGADPGRPGRRQSRRRRIRSRRHVSLDVLRPVGRAGPRRNPGRPHRRDP